MQFIIFVAILICLQASPGTWAKWDGSDFSQPALGGQDHQVAKLDQELGSNPTVSWNTVLQRYVMIYASWESSLYICSSKNATDWEVPSLLLTPEYGIGARYPTLMGANGDLVSGELRCCRHV